MGGGKLIKEWNLMNAQQQQQQQGGNNEVPKVADFLGVGGKSSADQNDQSEFVPYNSNDSDYLFTNNSLVLPVQHNSSALAVAPTSYDELQENAGNSSNNMQSLTLSMGSGKGGNSSTTCETTNNSNANTTTTSIVEATPRRTLDTFGQRTSIYRGVTR